MSATNFLIIRTAVFCSLSAGRRRHYRIRQITVPIWLRKILDLNPECINFIIHLTQIGNEIGLNSNY